MYKYIQRQKFNFSSKSVKTNVINTGNTFARLWSGHFNTSNLIYPLLKKVKLVVGVSSFNVFGSLTAFPVLVLEQVRGDLKTFTA